MNLKDLCIQMNKKFMGLLALLLLSACSTNSNSSSNHTHYSSSLRFDSSSSSSLKSDGDVTSSSSSSSSSFVAQDLDQQEAINALQTAIQYDDEVVSLQVSQYYIHQNYYQRQKSTRVAYSNQLTLENGTSTTTYFTNYSKIESTFLEQRFYQEDTYYEIRKFQSPGYMNRASKSQVDEETAMNLLNIGQAQDAYTTYQNFANAKTLMYFGEVLEDNLKYVRFISVEEETVDYVYVCALEYRINALGQLIDFYSTEGYYDSYYAMDYDVSTLRKHGPSSYGGGGITFEVTNFVYGEKNRYTENLPFPIEENFVQTIDFDREILEISIANLPEDQKYIDLYDYLVITPTGSLDAGCPINNIVFESSHPNVASIGDRSSTDGHYLDINQIGETDISAKDVMTQAVSIKSLHIVIS